MGRRHRLCLWDKISCRTIWKTDFLAMRSQQWRHLKSKTLHHSSRSMKTSVEGVFTLLDYVKPYTWCLSWKSSFFSTYTWHVTYLKQHIWFLQLQSWHTLGQQCDCIQSIFLHFWNMQASLCITVILCQRKNLPMWQNLHYYYREFKWWVNTICHTFHHTWANIP